jgi:Uma2 family endonuclease
MQTVILADESILQIPNGINDFAAFRRWAHSDEFPEKGRICYLDGEVWLDMSPEQLFTHNQVKNEFSYVLTGLAKETKSGSFFSDGFLLTNGAANLSCEPDGTYVLDQSFELERVRLVDGAQAGFVEMEGTPDLVLEVISDSSVRKDTKVLRELYWRAEIPEYWLVDARGERLEFDILRWNSSGYSATRKQAGWVKSRLFGCSFQLTCKLNSLGYPKYTLSTK